MVNYKEKYFKYKLKYLNIKNKHTHKSNIKGGAQNEREEQEMADKAGEDQFDIQFRNNEDLGNDGVLIRDEIEDVDENLPEIYPIQFPIEDYPPEINVQMGEDIEGDEDDEEIQVDMREIQIRRAPYIIFAVLERAAAALQDLMNNRRNEDDEVLRLERRDADILPDNIQVRGGPEEEDDEEADDEEADEEEEAHNEEAIDEEADEVQPEVPLRQLPFGLVNRILAEVREGDDPEEEDRRIADADMEELKIDDDEQRADEQCADVQPVYDHELYPVDDG